jgi:uroporphyrinogen-III synthase
MQLLITRPPHDAKKTAGRLQAAGHETTVQSMMRIEFASQPVELIDPLAILVTSGNAVRAMGRWPIMQDWRSRPVFAVGDWTATLARQTGFADIRIGPGNAPGLFQLVRASVNKKAGALLYPTSPGGADLLPRKLAEDGFSVFVLPAYRRLPVEELDGDVSVALAGGAIDGALFYSRQTAAIFADLARKKGIVDQFSGVKFYVLSEQIVEPLKSLNPAEIWIAESPNEQSMLDLIPAA